MTMQFAQEEPKKQKEIKDPKEERARQKKSRVILCGQQACSCLKEAFDILLKSLGIQV